jgi:hypothetical protein
MLLNIPYTHTGLLYPIKDKKNNGNTCAVRRLFNLGFLKRIKTIDSTVMFICPKAYRTTMGNANSGQQRFVTVAYRFMQINGSIAANELIDYIRNNHISSRSNLSVRKASAILNQHPMFITKSEEGECDNGKSKYAVAIYDIVPENDIVENLVDKLRNDTSLLYSFKKYPAFIRNQVLDALSDSPHITHEILLKK